MNKHLILTLILALALCVCGTAFAQESYNITFTDGPSHHDKGTTWSADIVLPNVSGMADAEEQKALNDYFQEALDATVASYEEDVAYVNENYPDGNGPHFSCDVNYEVVTDSDDYIVLKVWMFYAAGDSATFNQYWVFSKHTGKEVPMTDVITAEIFTAAKEQIRAEMEKANETEEAMYWVDDESLDTAMDNLDDARHWYINNDGDLVIVFDKYEIAPGAQGESEFVIAAAAAAASAE